MQVVVLMDVEFDDSAMIDAEAVIEAYDIEYGNVDVEVEDDDGEMVECAIKGVSYLTVHPDKVAQIKELLQ